MLYKADIMPKKREVSEIYGEITVFKLIFYNILFFVPITLSLVLSLIMARYVHGYFQTSNLVVAKVLMIFFSFITFVFIIPYIRKRESVMGLRLSLLVFLILAIFTTVPSALRGNVGLLLNQLTHIASYIFLAFVYSPEVLGVDRNITDWFKHHRQLIIVVLYVAIVLFYVMGFGWMFYETYLDNANSFAIPAGSKPTYGTFMYYSIISFATIGYGEIYPQTTMAKFIAGTEAVVGMVINVVFIAILLVYISNLQQIGQLRREEEREAREIRKLEKEELKEEKELKRIERMLKKKTTREKIKKMLKKR